MPLPELFFYVHCQEWIAIVENTETSFQNISAIMRHLRAAMKGWDRAKDKPEELL